VFTAGKTNYEIKFHTLSIFKTSDARGSIERADQSTFEVQTKESLFALFLGRETVE